MARDGHGFRAWIAAPSGAPRGAIVLLQEIFGVNPHIRAQADAWAAEGYVTIAPALYDRIGRNIETGYSDAERDQARGYMLQVSPQDALKDIGAALNVVRHAGRVALLGYCWGGTLAWLAARTLPARAAVAYYPGAIGEHLDAAPKYATLLHFAEQDAHVSAATVQSVRELCASCEVHVYPARHGFNCSERAEHDAVSATLAAQRTRDFLARQLDAAQA